MPNNQKHTLAISQAEKDIGVIFSDNLSLNKMLGLIRSYKFLNIKNFLPFIKPWLESTWTMPPRSGLVWSPSQQYLTDELESVQRRATKILPGLKNLTYEQRLTKLKLHTLAFKWVRSDKMEIFKIVKGLYDKQVVFDLGLQTKNEHNLRHPNKIEKKTQQKNNQIKLI